MRLISYQTQEVVDALFAGDELREIEAFAHLNHHEGLGLTRNDLKYGLMEAPFHYRMLGMGSLIVELEVDEDTLIFEQHRGFSRPIINIITLDNLVAVYKVEVAGYDKFKIVPVKIVGELPLVKETMHCDKWFNRVHRIEHFKLRSVSSQVKSWKSKLDQGIDVPEITEALHSLLGSVVLKGTVGRRHYQEIVNHFAQILDVPVQHSLIDVARVTRDKYQDIERSKLYRAIILNRDLDDACEAYYDTPIEYRNHIVAKASMDYLTMENYYGSYGNLIRKAVRQYQLGELSCMYDAISKIAEGQGIFNYFYQLLQPRVVTL